MPSGTRAGPAVSVLAYAGMSAFELGIVTEVFGLPRPEFDIPWYELAICAEHPGPVPVIGGASLYTPNGLDTFAAAQMASSYQGTSNSGRGRPNTSVTMPSSNADIPV